jgi:SAM-dependent methyltransferase
MNDEPIALVAYEELAEAFAAAVDTKPHNAYYERPATLSLLPPVEGKRVLDAGCGAGIYSEWLLEHGAEVLSIDASPKMIELTKQRLRRTVNIVQANLGKPLTFLDSASFNVVLSPLVMDYIQDWRSTFAEFYRVLSPGGCFIFSVGHPLWDFLYFKSNNYFETEFVSCEWKGFGKIQVRVPSFRRSLGEIINPLTETGFRIDRILEPKPTEEFKLADPRNYEELLRHPVFLCVRAIK